MLTLQKIDEILEGTGIEEKYRQRYMKSVEEIPGLVFDECEYEAFIMEAKRQHADYIVRTNKFKDKKLPKMSYSEVKTVVENHKRTLPQDIFARYGSCYKLAGKFIIENHIRLQDEDLNLVHGYLFKDEDESMPYGHAWLEINGLIYDPVYEDFEAANALKKARKRRPVYKYDLKRALYFLQNPDEMNWGPWEELPEQFAIRKGNIIFNFKTNEVAYI